MGLEPSVRTKNLNFGSDDALRPVAVGHDGQLTGFQIHCQSGVVDGGLQRALCNR